LNAEAHTLRAALDPDKPLLICDVDEVVLHFVAPFEDYLRARNARLKKDSFKLSGNIINTVTELAFSMEDCVEMIQEFHQIEVDKQPVVKGAVEGLSELSAAYQIIFVTNVAVNLTERRRDHLASIGAPYPVIQNNGSKAEVVQALCENTQKPTVFIDDLPPHHSSIKAALPQVNCIHFMADPEFRSIVKLDKAIGHKAKSWNTIIDICKGLL